MAYNNGFPVGYPQMYYPTQPNVYPTQMNVAPTQTTQNGIIWVQGESGAKSYLVAPGQSLLLMDSESEQFFIKTTDASGMPLPLRKFSYKEVSERAQNEPTRDFNPSLYVTKEEFESRLKSLKTAQKEDNVNE